MALHGRRRAQSSEAPQYDPSAPVNNGEDIAIEFWYWTGAANLFQAVVDEYTAIHPNVKITLVENPYEDYWTKLPLALQGTDGPATFNVHNSYHENLIGYLAPYDIPLEDLEADFVGVSAHEIDGNVYYTDYGMMTATMYYNKAMWDAAGLTEADIPKTWDQFREVAKKLTIRCENGELVQAGSALTAAPGRCAGHAVSVRAEPVYGGQQGNLQQRSHPHGRQPHEGHL